VKRHIILIGFKAAGKSTVGCLLAKKLNLQFYDIDKEIEKEYMQNHHEPLTCRQIVQKKSLEVFRQLEHHALLKLISYSPAVIALGGGTLDDETNIPLLQMQFLIHVKSPQAQVFNRIMKGGTPAFVPAKADKRVYFTKLWNQRMQRYAQFATVTVEHDNNAEVTVQKLISTLKERGLP
jgi:shikimate kinase